MMSSVGDWLPQPVDSPPTPGDDDQEVAPECAEDDIVKITAPPRTIGSTRAKIVSVIAWSPVGWVAAIVVSLVGLPYNAVASACLLATGNRLHVRCQWLTFYRTIGMCFTCWAVYARRERSNHEVRMIDVPNAAALDDVGGAFGVPIFRGFMGWIGETFRAERRYGSEQTGLVQVEMAEPDAYDATHATQLGMECRASPVSIPARNLGAMGIPHGEEITGLPDDNPNRIFRPVVFWFDGAETMGAVWQCAMNLGGAVPPMLYDAEDFFQERLAIIIAYNRDPRNRVKLLPYMAGHSMGGMIAQALAAKHHCGCLSLNGLGLERGIKTRFVGRKGMAWARSNRRVFVNFVAGGDQTSDPLFSRTFVRPIGRIVRFTRTEGDGDATYYPYGHFDYSKMLCDYKCKWRRHTRPASD